MRAVILAGGKGTRLRPFTTLIPKPLVPLGGRFSVLEVVLMQLRKQGFTHVTLAVNHFSNLIMAYFGDGEKLGLKIDYSLEEEELGTIGPLKIIPNLPDNFLVMNGDILCDLNYSRFFNSHVEGNRQFTISSFKRSVNVDFGVLVHNDDHTLTSFSEKPSFDFEVSMGVYAMSRSVLDQVPEKTKFGFDDLMHARLSKNEPVQIAPFQGFWLDIGRPDDYAYADENFTELSKTLGINE